VPDKLPTAREIRARLRAEAAAERQAAYERRYEARRLLFGVARGLMKNLTSKQMKFVQAVEREAYHAYLHDLEVGVSRWDKNKGPKWRKKLNPNRGSTLNFMAYRRIWWKGNKAVFRRNDTAKLMRERFQELQRVANS